MKLCSVADGQERNHLANYQRVLVEVCRKYAKQRQPRSAWQKFWLECCIKLQVFINLKKMYSSSKHYFGTLNKQK